MQKFKLLFLFLLLLSFSCYCQDSTTQEITRTATKGGVSLGSTIAVVISWHRNQSVLMAIVHGIFGWLYVIYYLLTREN